MTTDMVKNPPHYQTDSGLEAIDVIEAFFADNAHLANAFRYMSRLDKKWDGDEDLDKAIWYLQRLREFRNGDTECAADGEGAPKSPKKVTYEFAGRVRNIEFTTTQNVVECGFDMLPTMLRDATHHVRFEFESDGDMSAADLFIGKPSAPLVPESWTKDVVGAYARGGIVEAMASPKSAYSPGDKVVITKGSPDGEHKDWFSFDLGDVCEFVRDGDWDGKPGYSILARDGEDQSVPNAHFARQAAPLFRHGQRVRVTKKPSMAHSAPIGTIGKIQAGPDSDGDYEVKFGDDWHYFESDEIEAATEPKAGDVLTVTDTDGHNFPHGVQVKVYAPGGWGGTRPDRYVLCSRTDGALTECGMRQQAIRLDCTSW